MPSRSVYHDDMEYYRELFGYVRLGCLYRQWESIGENVTKRESFKKAIISIDEIGKKGFISLGLSLLSYLVSLPIGETLFGKEINIQSWLTIFSFITFAYFIYYVWLEGKRFWLKKTMTYEVEITGETGRLFPEIKIQNNEPVNIEDIHIEMIRFNHRPLYGWDMSEHFNVGDKFFSVGLPENRTASRSPIYIKIAEPVKGLGGLTLFLTDNHQRHFQLENDGKEFSKWSEYEIVFRITGKFSDSDSAESFGDYRTVLRHEQIQQHGNWVGQDIFQWTLFKKTNEKEEAELKAERTKNWCFTPNETA